MLLMKHNGVSCIFSSILKCITINRESLVRVQYGVPIWLISLVEKHRILERKSKPGSVGLLQAEKPDRDGGPIPPWVASTIPS